MTIPATNTKLLITEDWQKIYQSFRNADFQSYDFETIRRILIAYLQENYPEDFNDFIDSSEYVALIDLIAYLGQNLSFRIDLNARENFLETAQRRDSILRLAQLVGYAPKRNTPATGLLKVTAISTTDNVLDNSGLNLANTTIGWNDNTNPRWYEQFLSIMNSAMPGSSMFGKPDDDAVINGILTQQYVLNSSNTDVPVFSFNSSVNGASMSFEVVPGTFKGKPYLYEADPLPGSPVRLLFQNDNQGSGSAGTGFFTMFKQGTLGLSNFSISNPVPNEIIGINVNNINNTDVWLWQLDLAGKYPTSPWDKVPSVVGNNVIYNSISANIRNIYSVTSRDGDQIDLNFTDGSFGNLPKGNFVLYYRQSSGMNFTIKPEQMTGVVINVPYKNKSGQSQTLTLTLSLQYTVSNSSPSEDNITVQKNAPQNYYTQNRMVTGEDYNIAPLTLNSNILKVKSISRISSGVSKYFELSDVSGKYSSTNIFGTDGVLYKNNQEQEFTFSFTSRNDIFAALKTQLGPVISSSFTKSFYLDAFRSSNYALTLNPNLNNVSYSWNLTNAVTGQSRGYFYVGKNGNVEVPVSVGSVVSNILTYIKPGALIKFVPPNSNAGLPQYFLPNGKIVSTQTNKTVPYIWSTVMQVIGDGSNNGLGNLDDGTGPIILGNRIANGSVPVEIIPVYVNSISYSFENDLVDLCLTQRNFGLRVDSVSRTWKIIEDSNLNLMNSFSLAYQGDSTSNNLDSSWIIAFTWVGDRYVVKYRISSYVFQSIRQTGFYVDPTDTNFDYTNNTVIKDKVTILATNTAPRSNVSLGTEYSWQIDNAIIESDGYVDPTKVYVSFYSHQDSGAISQIIDPDSFTNIVGPISTGIDSSGIVVFKKQKNQKNSADYSLVDVNTIRIYNNDNEAIADGDTDYLYYIMSSNTVKSLTSFNTMKIESDYIAFPGRDTINFHYQHNSSESRRIDPAKSNIIDVYILTSEYDASFRSWLLTQSGTPPLSPTSQALENNYSQNLELIKTISDQIIYQPVKYKILFGRNAPKSLQARFKAVKNFNSTVSSNDIKSRILVAINNFFALDNWNFGQSFYFSELSAYVMNLLSPDITNFVIVPTINNFGSLYEIACQNNEIFVNGATASDIDVIDAITATQLNTTSIVTSANN